MAAIPFAIDLTMSLPPDTGQEMADITYRYSGQANSLVEYKLQLVGSGSRTLDFGTVPPTGAKVLLVVLAAGTGVAPVNVRLNGGAVSEEIAAGGCKLLVSPIPVTGVTSMVVDYTTDGDLKVLVLG